MTPAAKAQLVKALARDVGFDLVGITHADPVERAGYYRRWLAAGYAGTMTYLTRNVQFRAEPASLLPQAHAVVCVAMNYKRTDGYVRPADAVRPRPRSDRPLGHIAQYARGRDYHAVMREMLNRLIHVVRTHVPEPFGARAFVDAGPLLERELAARAGLGWIGKNTCLLNARYGSYTVLGEILTTLDLTPDNPVAQGCGSCTRCLQACPTRCILAPYQLDASRCISYLTIEYRGVIPAAFHGDIGDRLYGCDLCQQVCPYNARTPLASNPDLATEVVPAAVDVMSVIHMPSGAYRRLTSGSAATRARRSLWQRNAAIVAGNTGFDTESLRAALARAARDPNPAVLQAATASLDRLTRVPRRPPGESDMECGRGPA